jgi:hypothetical protein
MIPLHYEPPCYATNISLTLLTHQGRKGTTNIFPIIIQNICSSHPGQLLIKVIYPKYYIAINTEKELLRIAIWADKSGLVFVRLLFLNFLNDYIFSSQFWTLFHTNILKGKDSNHDLFPDLSLYVLHTEHHFVSQNINQVFIVHGIYKFAAHLHN